MNRLHVVAAAVLALGAASPVWAKPYALAPVAAEGQAVRFDKGSATLVSTLPGSEVWAIPPGQAIDNRATITIGVANDGQAAADIDYPSVEVYTAEGVRLATYDFAALDREAKGKAAFAGMALAFAGGLAASRANTAYGGSAYAVRATTANVINAGAAAAAVATVDADLSDNILQRTTVAPGQTGGGYVVVQRPPKGTTALRVRVTFAGDIHEMRFEVK